MYILYYFQGKMSQHLPKHVRFIHLEIWHLETLVKQLSKTLKVESNEHRIILPQTISDNI